MLDFIPFTHRRFKINFEVLCLHYHGMCKLASYIFEEIYLLFYHAVLEKYR